MSTPRRKRASQAGYSPRPWQPMRRAELIVPPATLAAAEADPMVARVLDGMRGRGVRAVPG